MPDDPPQAALLRATNTHFYKGARATAVTPLPRKREGAVPCLIEFSDGATGAGEIAKAGSGRWRLSIAARQTAKGAQIPARGWLLEMEGAAEGLPSAALRVIDRLA